MKLLTIEQLEGWRRFYDVEPWGCEEDDFQHARTRSLIAAAGGVKLQSGAEWRFRDFLLHPPPEVEVSEVLSGEALLQAVATRIGSVRVPAPEPATPGE